jgi:hypothetical protein
MLRVSPSGIKAMLSDDIFVCIIRLQQDIRLNSLLLLNFPATDFDGDTLYSVGLGVLVRAECNEFARLRIKNSDRGSFGM